METLIIIPARGGSKRLPKKNIQLLNNKPLITYTIEAALNVSFEKKVIVSTDDQDIARISEVSGAEIPFIRPHYLSNDEASSIDVVLHALKHYESDSQTDFKHVILLQPTSPLRETKHIEEAYQLYLKNEKKYPVIGVKKMEFNSKVLVENSNMYLEHFHFEKNFFEINGAIYITNTEILKKGKISDDKIVPYCMDATNSIDIDTLLDFITAETYIKERVNSNE